MAVTATVDPATLPDDPIALKALVAEYAQKLLERDRYIDRLQQSLVKLRRWQFGAKSEAVPDGQIIFPFLGTLEPEKPNEAVESPEPHKRRTPARRGRRVIPPDLPERMIYHDVPENRRQCPDCGTGLAFMKYDRLEQLDYHPASFFKNVFMRAVYVCKPCEGHVTTAELPVPAGPILGGLPGAGLMAQVVVAKYCDGWPIYRQSVIYARQGVVLPRSTMCDWVRQFAEIALPIVRAMTEDILNSDIIQTDDTVVRMLDPGRGRTVQGRMWAYGGNAAHNQVVYEFTPNRKEEHPLRFLKDYQGLVQADAYKGYDKLFYEGSGRTELGCMAHCRRYMFEARDTDPERGGTALGFIRLLYQVEAQGKPLKPVDRLALRQEKAVPILKAFKKWLDQESLKILPSSPIGEAIRYALGQWGALRRYAEYGAASIDNNAIERAIRGIAVTRKNFLFVGSEEGGQRAAVAYSLIESAKLNGIDPYLYIKDILTRVWTHPQSRIRELMPRLWKPASQDSVPDRHPPPAADTS